MQAVGPGLLQVAADGRLVGGDGGQRGHLVVVTPGPDHLAGLVDALGGLTVDAGKDDRLAAALEPHLERVDRAGHRWPLRLPHRDAVRAVAMGPSARHLADLPARVAGLPDPVPATASIVVTRYRRRH